MLNIPTISGLEYIGVRVLNDGTPNFIQMYVNDGNVKRPFLRVDIRPHDIMLEEFLDEAKILPEDCELVGGGLISLAHVFSDRTYEGYRPHSKGYALFGHIGASNKSPDVNHINIIRPLFQRCVEILYDKIDTGHVSLTNENTDDEESGSYMHDPVLNEVFDEDEFRADIIKTFNLQELIKDKNK